MITADIPHKGSFLPKIFVIMLLSFTFFLMTNNMVFSAENISDLVAWGEASLVRGDYKQLMLAGEMILRQDPRNLRGYRFILISCVGFGNDVVFYKVIQAAKKYGVPELVIEKLAIEILFAGNHQYEAIEKLTAYEKKWCELHAESH